MPRRSPKAVRDGLRPRVIPPSPHIAGLSDYTLACIARAEAALGHLARGRTESAYVRWRDFLGSPTGVCRPRVPAAAFPSAAVIPSRPGSSSGRCTHASPGNAPYDRVIAWTTPTIIPDAWTNQAAPKAVIVTPVKVAPVAGANLTIRAEFHDGDAVAVTLHEGSFVDLTPEVAAYNRPNFFVDAHDDDTTEAPTWLSAPAARNHAGAAAKLLDDLGRTRPEELAFPLSADDRPALLAHLAATNRAFLATAAINGMPAYGLATSEAFALISPDGLRHSGRYGVLQDLLRALSSWSAAGRPDLDTYTPHLTAVNGGHSLTLAPPTPN